MESQKVLAGEGGAKLRKGTMPFVQKQKVYPALWQPSSVLQICFVEASPQVVFPFVATRRDCRFLDGSQPLARISDLTQLSKAAIDILLCKGGTIRSTESSLITCATSHST